MMTESRGVIRLTHAFTASAERVFDAWLSPEKMARWLLPDAVQQVTRVEIDARVGGSIRFVTCRAGRPVEHTGEYLEIQRPHRLSFTIRSSASAETVRVTVRIEPRGAGCCLTLTSAIEPAPLRALAAFAGLEAYRAPKALRSHWPTLEGKAALSLGLHLAMLPLLAIVLREPPPPPGAGSPSTLAILTVDLGTADGVELAQPAYAPAAVAPGEAPAVAPPVPPAPAPTVPHAAAGRNTLPLPPSPATQRPNRAADNHATSGPDAMNSRGGGAGGDAEELRHRERTASAEAEAHLIGTSCIGTIGFSPDGTGTYYGGQQAPVEGRFFRDQSGRTWIRFTLWPGSPWTLPVTIAGSEIRWTGVNGNGYAVRPAGKNHLTGFAGFNNDYAAKIDFTCAGSNA